MLEPKSFIVGLKQNEPILVNVKMHAANNMGIVILAAIIVQLSWKDRNNRELETKLDRLHHRIILSQQSGLCCTWNDI